MEENKQVVAEWKQQNQDRLKEIKTFNPDLYSAINMALSYLNKTLTGEELPVEVEETIVEPQKKQELSVLDVASVSTLSDFYNTRIHVRNQKESEKFQELIFALGGKWYSGLATLSSLNTPYLFVDYKGRITTSNDADWFENKSDKKEIFFDDIFGASIPTKSETSEWRLKTKQELESQFGKDFMRYSIPENEMSEWYGKNLSEIYGDKYDNIKQAEDSLISNNIELGSSGFSLPKDYFTKYALTTSQTNGYKLPIDTYPVTLKNNYSFFVANDGSRQSPTQSAGDLKRMVMPMGTEEIQEIRRTFFRGNDGQWYEINVGKGGTWTWKKLNPVENYETQVKFIEGTQSTASQPTHTPYIPTSTPKPAQQNSIKFSFYDLVGRQLNWNGNIYKVVKLKKTNPKKIIYEFKNSNGGIESVNVPKTVVEALLTENRIVAGVKLLPKQPESTQYDYTAMSDFALSTLRRDTAEARDAFEFDDPEYAELSTQVGLMIDEMKRRNIL